MPDLATHAIIPYAGIRIVELFKRKIILTPTDKYIVILGSVFPDIVHKGFLYPFYYIIPVTLQKKMAIPSLDYLHTPFMILITLYIFSFLFPYPYRTHVFRLMFAGTFLHFILDLLQGNICEKGYMWFFPFSNVSPMAINIFSDDSTTPLVPYLLATVVLIEVIYRKIAKN